MKLIDLLLEENNPEDKVWAKRVFDNSKAYYHAVSRNSVAELFAN